MSPQSLGVVVIIGASSASGTVYADRLGLNRSKPADLSSREVSVGSSV